MSLPTASLTTARDSSDTASTASDATLDDDRQLPRAYRDDDDEEQDNDPRIPSKYRFQDSEEVLVQDGDEEQEQVGLIQSDRWRQRSSRQSPINLPMSSRESTKYPFYKRHRGVLIVVLSLLALPLCIVAYAWLISASRLPDAASTELVISGPSGLTADERLPVSSAVRKYESSTNDADGDYGLKSASGFAFNEAVPGWSTADEADGLLGFRKGTTQEALAKQGWSRLRPKTMDVIFNRTLVMKTTSLIWSAEDKDDGVFVRKDRDTADIIFEDVTHARLEQTGKGEVAPAGGKVTFVRGKDVLDENGAQLEWDDFTASPDLSHVMFFSDTMPVYRWSKKANVWIHNVKEKRTWPLGNGPSHPPTISHAAWVPKSSYELAYVQNNDLYVALDPDHAQPLRITSDGAATIFNAITDWVYEEEVYDSNHALWFSPGGSKLAYLRFNETEVPVYDFPIYNPDTAAAGGTTPYLTSVKLKYPKPGYKNPSVSAHLVDLQKLATPTSQIDSDRVDAAKYDLQSPSGRSDVASERIVDTALAEAETAKDKLVTEVVWLDDDSLYIRETDRGSDKMRGILFDTFKVGEGRSMVGTVVRRADATDKSWILVNHDMLALGARNLSSKSTSYLDIVEDEQGFKHLALFPNATSNQAVFLTRGSWEVAELLHADVKRNKAYVTAGYPLPYRRHIFEVDIPDITKSAGMMSSFQPNFKDLNADYPDRSFSASFDPKGAYYLLQQLGPRSPTSRVLGIDDPSFEWIIEDNSVASQTLAQFTKTHHVYYNLTLDDGVTTTTVQEIRPYDFDPSGETRYPVLLNVYGGPDSQKVRHSFSATDWHESLVDQLGYIVAIVDGRGTGFRGAEYRDGVTKQLGSIEIDDLLGSAAKIARLAYVDEKRIGLWGWSYGGYFTAKALERDSGILSLGMAVAPVTKWTFYDSIYTERYMKAYEGNKEGYEKSAVHVTDGFKHASFLLAHGSGDENVHFENSAHLLDLLTAKRVRGFWFRMFSDSAHSISTRGAYRELHEYLTDFLKTKWGAGGKRRFPSKAGRKALAAEHVHKRGDDNDNDDDDDEAVVEKRRIQRQEADEAIMRRLARRGL